MGESDKQPDLLSILPEILPIFPLTGAILLPGCSLPLNVFEPRYKAMIKDALNGTKIIGIIQPRNPGAEKNDNCPELCDIGGAGYITRAIETENERYLVQLTGLTRFRIFEEITPSTPYRQIRPDYNGFEQNPNNTGCHTGDNFNSKTEVKTIENRDELLNSLSRYLDLKGLKADINSIKNAPDDILTNSLSMIVPLSPKDKQALLEANSVKDRANFLTALLNMAIMAEGGDYKS